MRRLTGLLGLLISYSAFSSTIVSQIHEIDLDKNNEVDLILLKSGDVVKIPHHDQELKEDLYEAKSNKSWLSFQINQARNVLAVQSSQEALPSASIESEKTFDQFYTPTVLRNNSEAKNIFNNLNRHYKSRSECYQRAHIWAYESLKKYNLVSMKVFLFFTKKYIREYDYDWWFHAAPYALVREDGVTIEKVLDYTFTGRPLPMQKWTNRFMDNNATCPVITKYTQYSQHEKENWCYIFKTNMFYYQPLDLEALENQGITKNGWVSWEVNAAYQAFRYSSLTDNE